MWQRVLSPRDFAKSPAACHGENDMTNAEHMGWPWDGCSIKLWLQLQIDLQSLTVWFSGLNQGDLFSICYISIILSTS